MTLSALLLLLVPAFAIDPVSLLDLQPGFVQGGRILRNRTPAKPGLFLAGKRYRGYNCPVPCRVGFDLRGAFARFRVRLGVLEGAAGATFRVLGDGRVLAATPPLFPNAEPILVEVDVGDVLLLEIAMGGAPTSRAAVVEGLLDPAEGKDLTAFLPVDAPLRPEAYPAAFRRRVNDAIDRGARYLQATQAPNGSWAGRGDAPGVTALTLLAALKAGVKPDDPAVERAFAFLRGCKYERTYSVACLLMALEAKYFPGGADESDAYLERPRLAKTRVSAEDRAWIREAAEWLVEQQGAGTGPGPRGGALFPVWRYPGGGYDLSNTQYALFGLASANRCGVPTTKAWLPALRFLLGVQEKDGPEVEVTRYLKERDYLHRKRERAKARGFTYMFEGGAYGSMTSAGLCSLVLCQQALERHPVFQTGFAGKTREAIRDALAWIEEYYDVEENVFRGKTWWTYHLFNLERAGSLLGTRYIGTRDWYRDGAEELLAIQGGDGSFGDLIDTDFALLFLERATVPVLTNPLR
jgi:hypothetical protein